MKIKIEYKKLLKEYYSLYIKDYCTKMSLFDKKNAFSHFNTIRNKKKQLETNICSYCEQGMEKSNNDMNVCDNCNTTTEPNIYNNKCNYCGENTVIVYKGKYVCSQCGRENGTIISKEPEWAFSSYNKFDTAKPRCTMVKNPLRPSSSNRVSRPNSKKIRI